MVGAASPPQADADEPEGGLLAQLETVGTSRVGAAFWLGIQITAVLFIIAALYLLLRLGSRRLWRIYWTNREKSK